MGQTQIETIRCRERGGKSFGIRRKKKKKEGEKGFSGS